MAVPPATYAELRDLLHSTQVGASVRGFRLDSRTTLEANRLFQLTVTRSGNTWTCLYMMAPDGSVGRVMRVVDQNGRQWAPAPWVDGWLDAGMWGT